MMQSLLSHLRALHRHPKLFLLRPSSSASSRRRPKSPPFSLKKQPQEKSERWTVHGEMHEIGENAPPRERLVIPRDNIPNRGRKQLREQFMRRNRLVLKETEHKPWWKRFVELYNELRENWERLYWDEGYSKNLALDHPNYKSAKDDDQDFNPYRSQRSYKEQVKEQGFVRNRLDDSLQKVNQIRDKFEYDRERRMRDKVFTPMNTPSASDTRDQNSRNKPCDGQRNFSGSESDS